MTPEHLRLLSDEDRKRNKAKDVAAKIWAAYVAKRHEEKA